MTLYNGSQRGRRKYTVEQRDFLRETLGSDLVFLELDGRSMDQMLAGFGTDLEKMTQNWVRYQTGFEAAKAEEPQAHAVDVAKDPTSVFSEVRRLLDLGESTGGPATDLTALQEMDAKRCASDLKDMGLFKEPP